MTQNIYINLPVKDLEKSKEFFVALGFNIDKRFTDENAACIILGHNIYAMLLKEAFFINFIPGKEICNSMDNAEILISIDAKSREETDSMISKVLEIGGKEIREPQDLNWMYTRAFQDLDGHIWEIGFMDESKMPKEMQDRK